MSVTTYTTVNGQILCQSKDGVVSHFVSDPLGSVVMVRDNSGNTVYEAEYDPYGNVQSETGTNPSEFGYVGTLGYVKDSATSLYVRARYLLTNLGRWLTKDPLWPSEPGFVYAGADPAMRVDPNGAKPISSVCPPPPMPPGPVTCSPVWNQFVYAYCNCYRNNTSMCNYYALSYYVSCGKPKPRGDWVEFAPPPGQVGEVTPRPVPKPDWVPEPYGFCAVPPPPPPPPPIARTPCWAVGDTYTDPSPNEWLGKWGRCRSCCFAGGYGAECFSECNIFLHGIPAAIEGYHP